LPGSVLVISLEGTGRMHRWLVRTMMQRDAHDHRYSDRLWMNWAMHWGQGIALGAVRAFMAEQSFRGPVGSFLFLNPRLLNDQILENTTGVGAPPWT
jgi:hypothetical protein